MYRHFNVTAAQCCTCPPNKIIMSIYPLDPSSCRFTKNRWHAMSLVGLYAHQIPLVPCVSVPETINGNNLTIFCFSVGALLHARVVEGSLDTSLWDLYSSKMSLTKALYCSCWRTTCSGKELSLTKIASYIWAQRSSMASEFEVTQCFSVPRVTYGNFFKILLFLWVIDWHCA